MWTLNYSGRFKKDLKRYKNNAGKISKLFSVLQLLERDGMVPSENKPHILQGEYAGFRECHIENDFLLIRIDEKINEIRLVRLGTHSDLFK